MSSINSGTVDMDVDGQSNGPGTLKRCSSAPMINEGSSNMSTLTPTSATSSRDTSVLLFGAQTRQRRFSASSSPVLGSPVSLRLTPRINQLRQEEHADISNSRELAHERVIQHTIQMSQSCEDLSMSESQNDKKMGPLHVNLSNFNFHSNSPSPTRQYYTGFQSPTRGLRTFKQRSCSPVLKPSPLGVKRKLDDDKSDNSMSPKPKKMHHQSFPGCDRAGLLTTTSNSLPPGSISSVGTPESLSSADAADSPNFNFRNMDSPSPSRALNMEAMVVSKNDHEMNESPS